MEKDTSLTPAPTAWHQPLWKISCALHCNKAGNALIAKECKYTQATKWVLVFLKKKPPHPAKLDQKEGF